MTGEAVPERHRQRRPAEGRPKELLGPGKKRNKHLGGPLSRVGCEGLNQHRQCGGLANGSFLKITANSSCSAKTPRKMPLRSQGGQSEACPPLLRRLRNDGHGASAPLPTLQSHLPRVAER